MTPPRPVEEWARRQAQAVELPSCTCDQLPDDGEFHAFCTNHARMAKAIERSAITYAAEQVEAAYREAAPYTSKMRFTHLMVEQARAEEREACANLADSLYLAAGDEVATAIRRRGKGDE